MAKKSVMNENEELRLENEYLKESKLKLINATSKEIERLRQIINALSKSLRKEGFTQREIDQIQISVTPSPSILNNALHTAHIQPVHHQPRPTALAIDESIMFKRSPRVERAQTSYQSKHVSGQSKALGHSRALSINKLLLSPMISPQTPSTPKSAPIRLSQPPPPKPPRSTKAEQFKFFSDEDRVRLDELIISSTGKSIINSKQSLKREIVDGYPNLIPSVLVLMEKGLNHYGGYRKRKIFEARMIETNSQEQAYSIANDIISYFSSLPKPLLSEQSDAMSKGVNKSRMWMVIQELPDDISSVIQFLWDILAKVAMNSDKTEMNLEQCATVFAPICTGSINQDLFTCFRRGIEWRMDKMQTYSAYNRNLQG